MRHANRRGLQKSRADAQSGRENFPIGIKPPDAGCEGRRPEEPLRTKLRNGEQSAFMRDFPGKRLTISLRPCWQRTPARGAPHAVAPPCAMRRECNRQPPFVLEWECDKGNVTGSVGDEHQLPDARWDAGKRLAVERRYSTAGGGCFPVQKRKSQDASSRFVYVTTRQRGVFLRSS